MTNDYNKRKPGRYINIHNVGGNKSDNYTDIQVDEEIGLLDFLLKHAGNKSRTKIKATLHGQGIKVNGRIVTQFDYQLKPGMKVSISKTKEGHQLVSRYVKLVYEDRYLVVIEKAEGILSMAAGHSSLNVKSVNTISCCGT